jgi:hypothetical protein
MTQRMLQLTLRLGIAAILAAPADVWCGGAVEDGQGGGIELPRRIAPVPPAPPAPPDLPARASGLTSATFEWVVAWEGADGARGRSAQTVLRTVDRVLMVAEDGASEWLFERNPVDVRRVSGYRVDHEKRQILIHYDSDLRARLRLRGWADVLSLGFDPSALQELRATGERRAYAGAEFDQFVAPQPGVPGVVEVWWSESLMMPLLLTVREGDVLRTSKPEALDTQVETSRLADPRVRFPGYAVLDVADLPDRAH